MSVMVGMSEVRKEVNRHINFRGRNVADVNAHASGADGEREKEAAMREQGRRVGRRGAMTVSKSLG